jgi:murein DD-endopeptidase MepM/ murein hydrolase activator NlpD
MVFNKTSKKLQKSRLGEILLRRGLVNSTQLEQALILQQQQGQRLGAILVQQGLISPIQLREALAQQRWQNLLVSAILSIGAIIPVLPKMVQPTTVIPVASGVPSADAESASRRLRYSLGGLGAASPSNGSAPPNPLAYPIVDAIPLAANPTAANPLLGFCVPLQGTANLTQGSNGPTHQGRMRYAKDYQAPIGTPVFAMRSGRVIGVDDRFPDLGGGPSKMGEFNYVWIEHEGGYRTIYAHLQQRFKKWVRIKAGDVVKAGQVIGYSGNSGWSSGPHLHVEVQQPSQAQSFGQTVPFQPQACNSSESRIAQRS